MTIADLIQQGYRFYKAVEPPHVDCRGLRPLEDHLWYMHCLLSATSSEAFTRAQDRERASSEWARSDQWLRTAAGLRYVELDFFVRKPDTILCGRAAEYEHAASTTISQFMTEQTRLHYTWNATERLLAAIQLPSVRGNPSGYAAATRLLADHWGGRAPFDHYYDHAVEHLREHINHEPDLAASKSVREAITTKPYRAHNGLLLAVGNQLRHRPAHGDLTFGEPHDWGDGYDESDYPKTLHVPRVATRGLLFSLQMLLLALGTEDLWLGPWCAPTSEGWPIQNEDGHWCLTEDGHFANLLIQAHLPPPDFDNDDEVPDNA